MIEKQDYIDAWKGKQPGFFNTIGYKYTDFSKRVCALRELYEETNILFA